MTKKTTFMIAHGASVTVVRDGKRKTISAGGGEEFTDSEIATINRTAPGALRKPVNEGTKFVAPSEDDDDDGKGEAGKPETAKQKKARLAAEAKVAAAAKEKGTDAEDDADEDEDI